MCAVAGVVAQALQGLPAAEAGHVEVEQDRFDLVLGGEGEGLLAGVGFDDGVALALKVLARRRCGCRGRRRRPGWSRSPAVTGGCCGLLRHIARPRDAGQHDVERRSGAEVALRPDGAAMLLDDAAADGEAEAGAALLAGVGGLDLLEAVEDAVELIAGNAAAFVGDF